MTIFLTLILIAAPTLAQTPALHKTRKAVKKARTDFVSENSLKFTEKDLAVASVACEGATLLKRYGADFVDCACPKESTLGAHATQTRRDGEVTKILYGSFSKPLPQALVRISWCEGPHDSGLVLLSQIDGQWRREAYTKGFSPDKCVNLKNDNGLDSLACIASDQAMGCLTQWLEVVGISSDNVLHSEKPLDQQFSASDGSHPCGGCYESNIGDIVLGPGPKEFAASISVRPYITGEPAAPLCGHGELKEKTFRFQFATKGSAASMDSAGKSKYSELKTILSMQKPDGG